MIFLHFYDPPKPSKNPYILIKTNTFGLKRILVNMVLRCMLNSGPWGPHMAPFMTIFGILVNPPIPNIEKFQLYEV